MSHAVDENRCAVFARFHHERAVVPIGSERQAHGRRPADGKHHLALAGLGCEDELVTPGASESSVRTPFLRSPAGRSSTNAVPEQPPHETAACLPNVLNAIASTPSEANPPRAGSFATSV